MDEISAMKMMNNGYNSSFNSNSVGLMSNTGATTASSSSSTSTTNANSQSQGLKTYFKTPEGRYKLHYEKTHPPGFLPFSHGKSVSQVLSFFYSLCNSILKLLSPS